jgi:hypothetical protein
MPIVPIIFCSNGEKCCCGQNEISIVAEECTSCPFSRCAYCVVEKTYYVVEKVQYVGVKKSLTPGPPWFKNKDSSRDY